MIKIQTVYKQHSGCIYHSKPWARVCGKITFEINICERKRKTDLSKSRSQTTARLTNSQSNSLRISGENTSCQNCSHQAEPAVPVNLHSLSHYMWASPGRMWPLVTWVLQLRQNLKELTPRHSLLIAVRQALPWKGNWTAHFRIYHKDHQWTWPN